MSESKDLVSSVVFSLGVAICWKVWWQIEIKELWEIDEATGRAPGSPEDNPEKESVSKYFSCYMAPSLDASLQPY